MTLYSWTLLSLNTLSFYLSIKSKSGWFDCSDDIFQGGDIAKDIKEVRRGQRTIYRGLQRLFLATLNHQDLTASLVSMSDGLLMIRKNSANITFEIEEI